MSARQTLIVSLVERARCELAETHSCQTSEGEALHAWVPSAVVAFARAGLRPETRFEYYDLILGQERRRPIEDNPQINQTAYQGKHIEKKTRTN